MRYKALMLMLVILVVLSTAALNVAAEDLKVNSKQGTKLETATGEVKKPITIGVPPWSAPPVKARIVKQILEEEGYEVELENLDIGIVYQQMASDNLDCTVSAWLPTTHKKYWDRFGGELEEVAVNEPDTFLGLVVPQYVCDAGITSIPDLKGKADKFNGEIVGIEPGAGIMNDTEVAINKYNLEGYELKQGSTPTMLAALKKAIQQEEWIVVPLWQPHGAYAQYDLCNLEDPKEIYQEGEGDHVSTVCRRGFKEDYPKVYDFLKEFEVTARTQSQWIYDYTVKGKDPDVVAESWIDNHPSKVQEWKAVFEENPAMMISPKEFSTDIHQCSNTTFGIEIEEISGEAPLRNVHLENMEGIECLCIDCTCGIPSEWVSFDKNNFDVPAGGSATVSCTVNVPQDAEPTKYIGFIGVESQNNGYKEINLTLNVLEDAIPPEIVVNSPQDGEVVHKPYVKIKGVAKDNIGIKKLEIGKEIIRPLSTEVEEKEEYVKVPFEQKMQLDTGYNSFTIKAEDFAGNSKSKTISVNYAPETATPVPIVTVTQPPAPTPTPTPPAPSLENLSVSIKPEHREAKPGDSINYSITVDWRPSEWRGELKATAVISAAGFSKTYELPKVRPEHDPPITNNIQIPLPDNIPPLTYTMNLTVKGDSLKASDETELRVKAQPTPGFETVFAVAGLLAVAYLIRKR